MTSRSVSHSKTQRQTWLRLFFLFFFILLLGAYAHLFAIGTPYQPGSTLDPACAPGEVNCFVQIIPDQTSNGNKVLSTNGTVTSWTSTLTGITSVSTPSIISPSALTITPLAGTNLNVALSTTGDFAVNTNQLYVDTSLGNVGIGTSLASFDLSFGNSSNRTIGIQPSTASIAGKQLMIQSGSTSSTGSITFNPLSQTSRLWRGSAVHPNGNVYATVLSGDIYMQTNGTGDFNPLSQTSRQWWHIAVHPNGNVYAIAYNGDIYMQTNGTGDFNPLSQTTRTWIGIAVHPNGNVYAGVQGGDIYMQTNGTGDFNPLSQTTRLWRGIAAYPNGNVYAVVANGDIYMQTNGTGAFNPLSQTSRNWNGIAVHANGNVYATVNGGDIYMQTNGTGDFNPLSQTSRSWFSITTHPNGNVYATDSNGDIYMQTKTSENLDIAGSNLVLASGVGTGTVSTGIIFQTATPGISSNMLQTLSTKMSISGNGNIGIGTTSPTNILSLGNASAQKFWIENTATDVVGRALTIAAGGTVAGTSVSNVTGGNLILSSGAGTGTGASTLSFFTGTTLGTGTTLQTLSEKMTILGSGNVGIGTTGPSKSLEVWGAKSSGLNDVIRIGGGMAEAGSGPSLAFRSLWGVNNHDWDVARIGAAYDSGSYGGSLIFSTHSAESTMGSAPVEVMRINNLGNVGIGTTAPNKKFVVSNAGALGFEVDPTVTSGTITEVLNYNRSTLAYKPLHFYASDVVFMPQGGNVGIGTATPLSKLSINGGLHVGGDSDAGDNNALIDGTLGVTGAITGNINGTVGATTPASGKFTTIESTNIAALTTISESWIGPSSTTGVYFKGGNVGIGTTSPVYPHSGVSTITPVLQIHASGSNTSALVISSAASANATYLGSIAFATTGSSATDKRIATITAMTTAESSTVPTGELGFWTNNAGIFSQKMVIDKAGNVGIGDTTPDALLDVRGTVCLDINADDVCNDNTAALSDSRLKTNVTNIEDGLALVRQLRPVRFIWNGQYNTGTGNSLGFLAQEVETIFPDLVITDTNGYKNLQYDKLTAVLASAIQEMNIKVESIPTLTDQTLYAKIADFLRGIAEQGTAVVDNITAKFITADSVTSKNVETDKVQTNELCVKRSDGTNICVTGDQLNTLLNGEEQITSPLNDPIPPPEPVPPPTDEGTPQSDPVPPPTDEVTPPEEGV